MTLNATQCYEIDNTLSYYAQECRDGFDFTLLFEQTILTALPLGLLILVAPARIWYLSKKAKKTSTSLLLPLKVVCSPASYRGHSTKSTNYFHLIGIICRTCSFSTCCIDFVDITICQKNKRIDPGPSSFVDRNRHLLPTVLFRTHSHYPSVVST